MLDDRRRLRLVDDLPLRGAPQAPLHALALAGAGPARAGSTPAPSAA